MRSYFIATHYPAKNYDFSTNPYPSPNFIFSTKPNRKFDKTQILCYIINEKWETTLPNTGDE